MWVGAFFFLLCLHLGSASRWSGANCATNVTDAICCHTTACDGLTSDACQADWCHWKNGACKLNRDNANNVCCPEPVNEICNDIASGKCPVRWQVSSTCCANEHKYDGILTTTYGKVCCNTPCKAIEEAHAAGQSECTVELEEKPHCLPDARFGGMFGRRPGMPGMMGRFPGMGGGNVFGAGDIQSLLGIQANGPMNMGNVVQGFGNMGLPGGMAAAAIKQMGDDESKQHHVDEITVDDLMRSLISALDTDKEVFDYEREITSDPWFKKQGFGGMKSGFAFIDPWMFLDQIYGSPLGLSQAQMKYGQMYGIPMNSFSSSKFGGMGGLGGMGGMNGMGMMGMGGSGGMMGMGGSGGMMGHHGGMGGMGMMGHHGMGGMGMMGHHGGMGQHGMGHHGGMGHQGMGHHGSHYGQGQGGYNGYVPHLHSHLHGGYNPQHGGYNPQHGHGGYNTQHGSSSHSHGGHHGGLSHHGSHYGQGQGGYSGYNPSLHSSLHRGYSPQGGPPPSPSEPPTSQSQGGVSS